MFTVLPSGLSSACYIFTKLLHPLLGYWKAEGLSILVYPDDGLCAVAGEQNALEASELVRSTLNKAGFVAYPAKSKWEPTKCLQWLGFIVDLSLDHIEVPPEKINTLQVKLCQACKTENAG